MEIEAKETLEIVSEIKKIVENLDKDAKEKLKNLENEIKEKSEKLERSERENTKLKDTELVKKDNCNIDKKFTNKIIRLVLLGLLILVIILEIGTLIDKYYAHKKNNPTKDCCDIEKKYAIKESEFQKRIIELQKEHTTKTEESQKKIAELEKELCTLKSKTNEPKKEVPRYPIAPSQSQTQKNQTIEINYNKNPAVEKN